MTLNDYALLGYLVSEIAAKTGSCTIEHESIGGTALHAAEVLASQLGITLPRPVRAVLPTCPEIGSGEEGGA